MDNSRSHIGTACRRRSTTESSMSRRALHSTCANVEGCVPPTCGRARPHLQAVHPLETCDGQSPQDLARMIHAMTTQDHPLLQLYSELDQHGACRGQSSSKDSAPLAPKRPKGRRGVVASNAIHESCYVTPEPGQRIASTKRSEKERRGRFKRLCVPGPNDDATAPCRLQHKASDASSTLHRRRKLTSIVTAGESNGRPRSCRSGTHPSTPQSIWRRTPCFDNCTQGPRP
ncbi:hypothetical protein H310_03835 [Aphanomyces invadans]|uniref:Uncharacterized protein n=1 Tax=Aphanomyces invadans TaxID=157072 RepID=A0A024UE25_9STRA|nr:hypothetical protein H310_03835 [Aphanomyces invadans]ETW04671.1 hypothetical protein H310_03835 [Aphanomyces invadans]|eukprot:XP_008866109.1 hypothetical protein H310_03835 [Aphanomyces invadans]